MKNCRLRYRLKFTELNFLLKPKPLIICLLKRLPRFLHTPHRVNMGRPTQSRGDWRPWYPYPLLLAWNPSQGGLEPFSGHGLEPFLGLSLFLGPGTTRIMIGGHKYDAGSTACNNSKDTHLPFFWSCDGTSSSLYLAVTSSCQFNRTASIFLMPSLSFRQKVRP